MMSSGAEGNMEPDNMTDEELLRTMQFIVKQQVQFATDLQQVRETVVTLSEATIANTGQIGRILGIADKLADAQTRAEAKLAELAESQVRTDTKMTELAGRLDELTDRLNALISVVERYVSAAGAD